MSLLDVGSGPGTITADLAGLVDRVTAVEATDAAMALTRAEIERRGITNVSFVVSDIHALDLPDDSYDVVHTHQVLQHVADPVKALAELRRVTRPGGIVAARDADYAAFAWFPAVPELDEWLALYRRVARSNGGEPDAGRRLLSWAYAAGFTDVTPSADTWLYATPDDRAFWGGMWADRVVEGAFAEQSVASGEATPADLARMSAAWRRWTDVDDGWFAILNGEVLCRA
jgi:SAM-dependent methyltransferase